MEKKSRNLSGHKNFTQNHTTSWDKKIMRPLRTKKIMQPLGTKKIMKPLKKKKISLSIGPITSKLVNKAPNGTKFFQIGPKR